VPLAPWLTQFVQAAGGGRLQQDFSFSVKRSDKPVLKLMSNNPSGCRLYVHDAEVGQVDWSITTAEAAASPKQFFGFHFQVLCRTQEQCALSHTRAMCFVAHKSNVHLLSRTYNSICDLHVFLPPFPILI
jgi:hypothetical protein